MVKLAISTVRWRQRGEYSVVGVSLDYQVRRSMGCDEILTFVLMDTINLCIVYNAALKGKSPIMRKTITYCSDHVRTKVCASLTAALCKCACIVNTALCKCIGAVIY